MDDELRRDADAAFDRWWDDPMGGDAWLAPASRSAFMAGWSARAAVVGEAREPAPRDLTRLAEVLKAGERARIQLEGDGCVTALDEVGSYLDGWDNALDLLVRHLQSDSSESPAGSVLVPPATPAPTYVPFAEGEPWVGKGPRSE